MENYKIFENRPELSSKELTEGMDFTKLKANVAAAKMTLVKSIIIKTIFGAAIVTSGIVIYNKTKVSSPKQETQQLALLTDTNKSFSIVEAKPMVDTIKEVVTELAKDPIRRNMVEKESTPIQVLKVRALADTIKTTAIIPEIQLTKNCYGTVVQDYNPLSREKNTETTSTKRENLSKNTNINSCKIWNANNFCNISDTPDKYTIECDECEFDYVNCKTLKTDGIVCVQITLTGSKKSNLKIESKLKNITLTDATNNKTQTPTMVGIGSDNNFYGSNFKAKKFIVMYNKQMTIYLFFKNAKAGDKVIIKNFIEAIIEP